MAVTRGIVRHLITSAAWLVLGAVLLLSVLAQWGEQGWVPELATHFRIQYLAASVLLMLVFGVLRRWWPALLAGALLAVNAWHAAPYLLPGDPPVAAASSGRALRLVSLNLYYRNQAYARVRDYLREIDPDVLVLSELTPAWGRELKELMARYPFRKSDNRRDPWGLGVFSRFPLREASILGLGVSGSINIRVIVDLPGGAIELVAVHLASPSSPAHAAMRNRQLDELAGLLGRPRPASEQSLPRMIVGDMNVTPFSPYFRQLLTRTGLRDARQAAGFSGTWPTWLPVLQIPIDHCLADPALAEVAVMRGPWVGSDHYPLEMVLRHVP